MTRLLTVAAFLLCWSAPDALSAPTVMKSPSILWEPYTGQAVDGSPLEGELGRLLVPEHRGAPGGKTIEIAFVRYRTTNPKPGPTIFFLAGGPGGSGVEGCALPATHPRIRLLEHADVIGIDQRGTGLSRPNLSQPEFPYRLPLDRPVSRRDEHAAFTQALTRALRYWQDRGVEIGAYNSAQSADDVEAVRQALGLDKITLYGSSYGSHLGLALLRRHPDSVARAVFKKVEGPDQTWKLPSTTQGCLEKLHLRVAADPALRERLPDLIGGLRGLLDRLDAGPVSVDLAGKSGPRATVVLGPYDLKVAVAHSLAKASRVAALPARLAALMEGDWTWLAEEAVAARSGSVHSLMAAAMDCASGASPERMARMSRELADSGNLLGDALSAPFYHEACREGGLPELGGSFRESLHGDAPILFVSGALDARTPPENVTEIRDGFPNAVHVVVENAGHESRELLSPEFRELLQSFLRGEPVSDCVIELPFLFDPLPGREAEEE